MKNLKAGKKYEVTTDEEILTGTVIARDWDPNTDTEVYIMDTDQYSFRINIPVYEVISAKEI